VAFSKGMAELTLKKPPPTEPSVLIAAQVATGWWTDWTTPCVTNTAVATSVIGTITQASARHRSTQKLPSASPPRAENPRMTAIATARPTAAPR
jgi:hypothetical protein